jgi:hypothetical protein
MFVKLCHVTVTGQASLSQGHVDRMCLVVVLPKGIRFLHVMWLLTPLRRCWRAPRAVVGRVSGPRHTHTPQPHSQSHAAMGMATANWHCKPYYTQLTSKVVISNKPNKTKDPPPVRSSRQSVIAPGVPCVRSGPAAAHTKYLQYTLYSQRWRRRPPAVAPLAQAEKSHGA